MARTSPVVSLFASSSTKRRIESAIDFVARMVPWPAQRGHTLALVSPNEGRKRWRDISNRPKREMRPS